MAHDKHDGADCDKSCNKPNNKRSFDLVHDTTSLSVLHRQLSGEEQGLKRVASEDQVLRSIQPPNSNTSDADARAPPNKQPPQGNNHLMEATARPTSIATTHPAHATLRQPAPLANNHPHQITSQPSPPRTSSPLDVLTEAAAIATSPLRSVSPGGSEALAGDDSLGVPRHWTKVEDLKLRKAVDRFGGKQWKAIAAFVPGRTHTQCLQRWNKVLKPGLRKGPWTEDEDTTLCTLVQQFHPFIRTRCLESSFGKSERQLNDEINSLIPWNDVAPHVPGRSIKQCRERWCYNLDPSIKKGDWSPEEDELLLQTQKLIGNRWAQISRMLPGRTEHTVKTRFRSIMRARKREWKPEEDALLLKLHSELGSRWESISRCFPNRTKNAVNTRFKALVQQHERSVANNLNRARGSKLQAASALASQDHTGFNNVVVPSVLGTQPPGSTKVAPGLHTPSTSPLTTEAKHFTANNTNANNNNDAFSSQQSILSFLQQQRGQGAAAAVHANPAAALLSGALSSQLQLEMLAKAHGGNNAQLDQTALQQLLLAKQLEQATQLNNTGQVFRQTNSAKLMDEQLKMLFMQSLYHGSGAPADMATTMLLANMNLNANPFQQVNSGHLQQQRPTTTSAAPNVASPAETLLTLVQQLNNQNGRP